MPRKKKIPEAVPIQLAAEILSVHPQTIRRWIKLGIIGAVRVGPLFIRIPRSEIAKFRKNRILPDLILPAPPAAQVHPSTGRR